MQPNISDSGQQAEMTFTPVIGGNGSSDLLTVTQFDCMVSPRHHSKQSEANMRRAQQAEPVGGRGREKGGRERGSAARKGPQGGTIKVVFKLISAIFAAQNARESVPFLHARGGGPGSGCGF